MIEGLRPLPERSVGLEIDGDLSDWPRLPFRVADAAARSGPPFHGRRIALGVSAASHHESRISAGCQEHSFPMVQRKTGHLLPNHRYCFLCLVKAASGGLGKAQIA